MKPRTIPLLFDRFPEARGIPWTCLIETATPVRRLERFGGALGGAEVWIKQDSLTSPVYGGNKTRKLEFLLGEAVAKGAKRVMTAGAIGSNHCMATTLHAGRLGMRTSLLLHPQSFVSDHARRQLLAFRYYGADLRWMDDRSQQEERSAEWSRELCEAEGAEPYWIPIGGSTATGALGLVDGALELAEQVRRGELRLPARLYVPAGSMGTLAGLALGAKMARLATRVVGVRISPPPAMGTAELACRLANDAVGLLRQNGCPVGDLRLDESDLEIVPGYWGEGYSIPSPEGRAAVSLLEETEGIALDQTYTGKALSALIDAARANPRGGPYLFWNTYSAADHLAPAQGRVRASDLPREFHRFFDREAVE